jgi:tyrosyl-tRNA synthetase
MWFTTNTPPSTDPQKIEDFLTRGVSGLYPEKEKVRSMLMSGKKLSMYLGIDPTGPTLHLGHAIAIRKMKAFQELGHTAILLIGSFTAQIGDPTDKLAARVRLTEKQVMDNAALYKQQASAILNFSGSNPAKLMYNGDWLAKMTFADVIEVASKVTVQEMLKRDMFETRMKEEKPIYLHEFFYPLMQGYDSVAMDVDGEVGGNDQLFNMLVGRDLVRSINQKEKFVLTMKLLTDSSGKKMGKTEGNMAALSDTPTEVFGKVMSWTDGMILGGFELCTDVATSELPHLAQRLTSENPRDLKLELAQAIVESHFGQKEAAVAREAFTQTFSKEVFPANAPVIEVAKGTAMRDALKGIFESNSELTRHFTQGSIQTAAGEKITDPFMKLEESGEYRIGKKEFRRILVK